MTRALLALMIAWDATGHATQLVAGRDWSVGKPLWLQIALCNMWFPDVGTVSGWTVYNGFYTAYWALALLLAMAARRAA